MSAAAQPGCAAAGRSLAVTVALAAVCVLTPGTSSRTAPLETDLAAIHATTSGAIAIENLDQQIARAGDAPGVEELLLTRAQFLADSDALDRAVALAESRCADGPCATAGDYVRRARARSAVHRFADALADLDAAARARRPRGDDPARPGPAGDDIAALRATILVATGSAGAALLALEAWAAHDPGLASRSALAGAYAAVGRVAEADQLYAAALAALDTTSPFPYAQLYFSRGVLWAEQANDRARGEAMYQRALDHLPRFAAAGIHLASLEAARGEPAVAAARIAPIARSGDPEALALAGALHLRAGDPDRGRRELAEARVRFEALVARHPLAFADHAAAFYLADGADPERACALARLNLAARRTHRALDLALAAAHAAGRAPADCS